jgi:diguanylate cyclase (GGDEF)-like protein
MANYAAQLNFQKLQTPLVLKGKHPHDPPDELERVVLSLNRMREALLDEMEVQKQTETELELHRNHLAEIVRARTAALNEKTKELEEQKKAISLLANTDVLTGVYTRRYFYDLAKLEISRSWRSGEPLSLLLLDIDFFKQVNDEHGHAVGDAALIAMAGVFKATLRDFDVVGRMGGEEFAVLLAGNDLERARLAAERLRLAVSEASLLVGERALSLTVSVGVTALATPDQDVDSLLKIADDALYQAKREGRNRVVVGN